MTLSLDLRDSCAGAVYVLLANPGLLHGWIRSLWLGTMSPCLCGHLGKESTQESMKPVLWSRLGARTQGLWAPPNDDVQDDLQGHVSAFSAALSFPPEHLWNG